MKTFVSVGNAVQPFSRLLAAVELIADSLPQPVLVQRGNTPFLSDRVQVRPFVTPTEFSKLVAESQVLILQAGAGSVIHALRAGRKPVVVPRLARFGEVIDDHQVDFARALAESGRLWLVEDVSELLPACRRALGAQERDISRAGADSPLIGRIREAILQLGRRGRI